MDIYTSLSHLVQCPKPQKYPCVYIYICTRTRFLKMWPPHQYSNTNRLKSIPASRCSKAQKVCASNSCSHYVSPPVSPSCRHRRGPLSSSVLHRMRATERNIRRHRHLSCFPPSTVPRPTMKGWENFPSTPLLGGKTYWTETKIITCFPYNKWQQIKARCTNSVAFRLAGFAGDAHWGRSDVLNWLLGLVGPYRVTEAMWLFCITWKRMAGKKENQKNCRPSENSKKTELICLNKEIPRTKESKLTDRKLMASS